MDDRPPVTPDLEEGVMGLTQVEPSPVEETPAEFKEDYFPSTNSEPQRTSTSTLGLGNHGAAWYQLRGRDPIAISEAVQYFKRAPTYVGLIVGVLLDVTRVQRYSSYAFTVFASFHIANTSIIPLFTRSVAESNRYLLLTRPYYQSALTEPLLVGLPLVAHVTSGIALRFYRRRQALKRYGAETHRDRKTIKWPPVSGTSALGYLLLPLAAFHSWTTRGLPIYLHGDSSVINLSYISHGFALHPFVSFAGFTALVGVGVWHTTWGWARWLGLAPHQVTGTDGRRHLIRKRRWYGINAVSALVAGLWLAGGLGVVGRGGTTTGWIGREFDELYNTIPVLRSWGRQS